LWIQSAQKRVNKTYKHDKYKQIWTKLNKQN
jgi:hypothetical protein